MSVVYELAFSKYDQNKDGTIGRKELLELCEELGTTLSSKDVEDAFNELDKDGNGKIEKGEFFRWWEGSAFSESGIRDSKSKTCTLLEEIAKQGRKENYTDIFVACWRGERDVVKAFIQEDHELASQADTSEFGGGYKPLHYAAYQGHLDILKLLIEQKENLSTNVNINDRNDAGCTALFLASQQGHGHCVEYLLKKGARQNIAAQGISPLDACSDENIQNLLQESCGYDGEKLPLELERRPNVECNKFGTLAISWSYSPDNNPTGTPAVTGYFLEAFAETNSGQKKIKEVNIVGADEKRTLVKPIASIYPVFVRIAVRNSAGLSKYSQSSEKIQVCSSPSMSGSVPRVRVLSRTSVLVSWNRAISNGSKIKSYEIYASVVSPSMLVGTLRKLNDKAISSSDTEAKQEMNWKKCGEYETTAGEATISGLSPGTRYTFRVVAVNGIGSSSSVPSDQIKTQGGSASAKGQNVSKEKTMSKLRTVAAFQKRN